MTERPAILMRRVGNTLQPCAKMDAEALEAFDAKRTVRVRITQPRNVGQHRLYWAALKLSWENMDDPPPLDKLHEAVKVRLGYASTMTFKDGSSVIIPQSIAFDQMPQDQFKEFFAAFVHFVQTVLIPGIDKADFEREAEAMLSAPFSHNEGG